MNLQSYIRDINDFPKKGINFKDITPLLNNAQTTKKCVQLLLQNLKGKKIDKVVGIESRGFFFGTLLAQELNAGFVPVRKPNKLPYQTLAKNYSLEYGTDTLEIHTDAIKKGDNVLIHDDVLATGGTAKAVCDLVEQLEGKIIEVNFLMELSFLNGRDKLNNKPIFSVLQY